MQANQHINGTKSVRNKEGEYGRWVAPSESNTPLNPFSALGAGTQSKMQMESCHFPALNLPKSSLHL